MSESPLLNLVDDVLLQIFPLCDISDIISASQTCRRLHTLVFDKQVWLELIYDLDSRLFLDRSLQRDFHELSTAELIDLVKRAVHGPETWSDPCPTPPIIARQQIIHPNIRSDPGNQIWEKEVILLPGDEFILFNNWDHLECWSVAEDRLIWKHQGQYDYSSVLKFDAEVVESGEAAIIVIGLTTTINLIQKHYIEVIYLDLVLELSDPLLLTRTPTTTHSSPFAYLNICEDIAIARMNDSDQILVINWKTKSCRVLLLPNDIFDVYLVPGHIIALIQHPIYAECRINIWTVESLVDHWHPNDSGVLWPPLPVASLPATISGRIRLHSTSTQAIIMSAHCSPLRSDSYTIWVYISSDPFGFSVTPVFTILKSLLVVPSGAVPRLFLRYYSSMEEVYPVMCNYISYAGHLGTFDSLHSHTERIWALNCPTGRGDLDILDLQVTGDFVHVSTYSGALTFICGSTIVVNHYQ